MELDLFFRRITDLAYSLRALVGLTIILFLIALTFFFSFFGLRTAGSFQQIGESVGDSLWTTPDQSEIRISENQYWIRYGRELIVHTSVYLGPNGSVSKISNGLNCQNCHLEGGRKPFGNNFDAVTSKYPIFQDRSGTLMTLEERINGCFERSLNGSRLDESSREMIAMVSYIKWIGKELPKGQMQKGFGLKELPFLVRPADPKRGEAVFRKYCASCHGLKGEGVIKDSKLEWKYPPLYGQQSYSTSAGIYRISKLASFVKSNMPLGATYNSPILTDEEAWDVAAYVNSMPHPTKDVSKDWPDIRKKPFDYPFGPYADNFSEQQHKYGPFNPMVGNDF